MKVSLDLLYRYILYTLIVLEIPIDSSSHEASLLSLTVEPYIMGYLVKPGSWSKVEGQVLEEKVRKNLKDLLGNPDFSVFILFYFVYAQNPEDPS